jgi:hypothetical protein
MSNTPAAGLTAPDGAVALPTELDARRELAREFRIERLLGQAPIHYLARDAEDRVLSIKVVPRGLFEESAEEILEPVSAAKRLDHPHIARVYGSGTTDNFLWYATHYVEGRTLASLVRAVGTMELAACLRIFQQAASALDYAHRRGVSHGALTAEGIVVDENEWVVVGDFGTAKLLPSETASAATRAADQRALALLVRQCLTGRGGQTREAELPLHVSQALRRAMSSRTDQFRSVLDFVAALDEPRAGGARGGTPPEPLAALPGSKPHSHLVTPVVIVDPLYEDPASTHGIGWRVLAVAALVFAFAVAATWISLSSAPAEPPSVPTTLPAPAPVRRAGAGGTGGAGGGPDSVAAVAPQRPVSRTTIPAPAPAAAAAPAPTPARAPSPASLPRRPAEPGFLSINAIPWGSVFVDGRPVGNTPQLDVPIPAGQHRLRVERQGYRPYERVIDVAPGQRLRITDIALVER